MCTLTRDNYLSCVGNASKLIKNTKQQNAQCSSLDIYVITLYCYMFETMMDHQVTGIKCPILYKELSNF